MSRYFPYPPPGHLRQGLVESIKLNGETVLPKSEHKLHKKRERKEKKSDKKGKDKTECPPKKLKKLDDVLSGYKDEDQLERSDLTEEHGPPASYVSDCSQNSHKRKRGTVSRSECMVDGKKLKIRFTLKTPRGSDASISEEPTCSSGGRADSSQDPSSSVPSVPRGKLQHDGSWKERGPFSEPSCSVAHVAQQKLLHDVERKEIDPTYSRTSTKDKKILKAALQYEALIENWLPPLLEPEMNDDNGDDWLLPKKQLAKPVAKRSDDNDALCHASSTSWPQAHYLPEASIYALPYTVPF